MRFYTFEPDLFYVLSLRLKLEGKYLDIADILVLTNIGIVTCTAIMWCSVSGIAIVGQWPGSCTQVQRYTTTTTPPPALLLHCSVGPDWSYHQHLLLCVTTNITTSKPSSAPTPSHQQSSQWLVKCNQSEL